MSKQKIEGEKAPAQGTVTVIITHAHPFGKEYTDINVICKKVKEEMLPPAKDGSVHLMAAKTKDGKTIAGIAYVHEEDNAEIKRFVVDPEWKDSAAGPLLMKQFLKQMTALEVYKVTAQPKDREIAVEFYERQFKFGIQEGPDNRIIATLELA